MDQSFHLSNFVLAAVFLPLLFFETEAIDWAQVWKPIAMGMVFFVANWLTFLSLKKGDVSLVTPLMGTKVVFVAIAVVLLMGQSLSSALWFAAILTAIGIFVMGLGDIKGGSALWFTIIITLGSAACFGLSDVLVSWWAGDFAKLSFLSFSCLTIAICSAILWLFQKCPSLRLNENGRKWAWWGALLVALQALGMGYALSFFADDATGINVVYASRGLWVIVLVVVLGKALGNQEHQQKGKAFWWRVLGTVILTGAIVIAVVDRAKAV